MLNPAPLTYAPCRDCGAVNRVRVDASRVRTPVCSRCREPLPVVGAVVAAPGQYLQKLAISSPLPVIVDAWASWCGPCMSFAPVFEAAANAMVGRMVFAKLNTEQHSHTAAQLGIRGIPTLIAFKDGRELGRTSGALSSAAFRQWLETTVGDPT